ncbi:MAG TPA: sulfotransferase [Chloroflexi bacterium]|nr:sulfotransferase [Chloroflexota bacterium]
MVAVVSGLPRSGTSMMMKMLDVGGIPPLTDEIREADADNPKGYYEFERVKKLDKGDTAWVEDAEGKAVKVIAALLKYLPSEYTYKVIFMRRKIKEVLASQKQMLINRGEPTDLVSDKELTELFEKHLQHIEVWAHRQNNVEFLYVSYNDLLANPRPQVERVNQFLGDKLDMEKMVEVVDPNLYRQRRG